MAADGERRDCNWAPRASRLDVLERADEIERTVLRELFDLFGNPAEIERAVKAAVPDCEKLLKSPQPEAVYVRAAGASYYSQEEGDGIFFPLS
jgi:hypothetical protein